MKNIGLLAREYAIIKYWRWLPGVGLIRAATIAMVDHDLGRFTMSVIMHREAEKLSG